MTESTRSTSDAARTAGSDPKQWVDQHGDHLYRYAMSRVRKTELAEDLVQETFAAALQARDSFAGQASERTWLIAILRRKIVDHIRKRSRERPESEVGTADETSEAFFDKRGCWKSKPVRWPVSPVGTLVGQEFWEAFFACVGKLPQRIADTYFLREMDQLDTEEVCKVLDISASNLWTQMCRARMLLRRCLEENWFARKKHDPK